MPATVRTRGADDLRRPLLVETKHETASFATSSRGSATDGPASGGVLSRDTGDSRAAKLPAVYPPVANEALDQMTDQDAEERGRVQGWGRAPSGQVQRPKGRYS